MSPFGCYEVTNCKDWVLWDLQPLVPNLIPSHGACCEITQLC